MPDYGSAIASIESGGNYSALGPETKGDRAYGKYQVMGANIPEWSRQVLGVELTPQQFLENPQAQDAIFQGKFGQYVQKYGPEGAAKAWFAGERGMNNPNAKDVLGTTVAGYGSRFMTALGAPGAPQPAPAVSPMPAYGWSPQAQPQPQRVASAQPEEPEMEFQQAPFPAFRLPSSADLIASYRQSRLRKG